MKKINFIFVLLFLMLGFTVRAQVVDDTVRTIIFSEANGRTYTSNLQYVELANVGSSAVNLKNFELGNVWRAVHTGAIPGDYGPPMVTKWIPSLPDTLLQPGETFLIAKINDYADKYNPNSSDITLPEILENVDLPIFRDEYVPGTQNGTDSISDPLWENILGNSLVSMGYYLEYHVGGDSALVDAIHNPNNLYDLAYNAVAGVPEAWGLSHILVRKTSVTQGNFSWDDARGTNLENSEWLPIPFLEPQGQNVNQRYFTTVGHHESATLDAQSVSSTSITIDWANSKMTVPWGIRKDLLMDEFELGKGLAWNLSWSPSVEDSTHNIVLTGDTLTMYAVGETLQTIDFELEQAAPAEDMNLVFPKNLQLINNNEETYWTTPFYVTNGEPGMDSIGNVAFRTRVDTLFKYLEKAENASWEITWVDGVESPDVKRGDILKVTAANGSVKDYYIAADSVPEASSNATLSAITWPDVPTFLRESPQWEDDTIPGFAGQTRFVYEVYVPYGTSTIPALKAIPSNLNAKVTEERATLITGTLDDRTTTFTVTAEDDSTVNVYTVTFIVEKPSELVQPFTPDPIISRLVYRAYGTEMWIELSNPGNQPLDMSKYMIIWGGVGQTPPDIISAISATYANRLNAYVPGYWYQSETEWNVKPGLIEKDLSVNPLVEAGGSFVLGYKKRRLNEYWWDSDIIFSDVTEIPEEIDKKVVFASQCVTKMHVKGTSYLLLEVVNDSIREGTKGIKDIKDFRLVDVFGDYTGANWTPAGLDVNFDNPKWNFDRKPEFWQGDTLPGYNGSWGETEETSEWVCRKDTWYAENGYDGFEPMNSALHEGIGSHVFLPISIYNSTVTSYAYKVSDGYQTPQSIEGVVESTTVSQFLTKINKNDADQVLEVMGKGDNDLIVNEDTLMVTSADGSNVTKYTLLIGALDSDATLKSSVYQISEAGESGTIAGIPVGTSIVDVLSNVTKSVTAVLTVVDEADQLIPLQVRNYDTTYVNSVVTNDVYFEVMAEDGVTKILYQLNLGVENTDAFVFSDMFTVDQDLQVISDIPGGIRLDEFMAKLTVNEGAGIALKDKTGVEITEGNVAWDDIIVVTSPDGSTTKIYALNFLAEPSGTDAYVVSDVYVVDQLNAVISDIVENTDISSFLASIRAATGATVTLLDVDGNEKTAGNVEETDQLSVVSGNGEVTVVYSLEILVGINPYLKGEFKVYPNPATEVLYIEGLGVKSEVVIRNILGELVKHVNLQASGNAEMSVSDLTPGIYFIYLKNEYFRSNPLKVVIQ